MTKFAALAIGLALIATSAAAQSRLALAPASDWVMNYDDDSCALQRQFGTDGREVFLELRRFGPSEGMQVIVASADFTRRDTPSFRAAIGPSDLEPTDRLGFNMGFSEGYEGKMFPYDLVTAEMALFPRSYVEEAAFLSEQQRELVIDWLELSPEARMRPRRNPDPELTEALRLLGHFYPQSEEWQRKRTDVERAVTQLVIDNAFSSRLVLQTGELHAPLNAMRACLDDLYTHWGIDADAHKTLSRPVLPVDMGEIARRVQEKYPSSMIARGLGGYLRIRMNVAADGKPTGCHLQTPINDAAFDEEACSVLMRYAVFQPALDAQGRPIASVFQTSIIYQVQS